MKNQIQPIYSKIRPESGSLMNSAEEQIRQMATEGNVAALKDSVSLAVENPQGEVAQKLETVGLRVQAHDLFTKTKNAVSLLHETRPVIEGTNSLDDLTAYENSVEDYIKAHNGTWHDIVGPKDTEPMALRIDTLNKLGSRLADYKDNKNNVDKKFMDKAFTEMGVSTVQNDGLRSGIASSSVQIVESVWGVVGLGRDAQADILEGRQIDQVRTDYESGTDALLVVASDIATDFIVDMNAFKSGQA